MAQRLLVTLTVTSLLGALAAGCGSASSSTSTSRAAASPAPTTTASGTTPASTPAAPVPAGFTRYRAKGFTFVAPAGMKPAPNGGIGGLPRGATAVMLTPDGRRVERTSSQIIVATNPRLRPDVTLDQVATSLETADKSDPRAKDVHTDISTMTVPGAEQVRIVTESYIGPNGPHARALFHRTWLMVLPKPGLLMDLVVVNEPKNGGHLNPATVLSSFRLGS
jgi:hypothetical protein